MDQLDSLQKESDDLTPRERFDRVSKIALLLGFDLIDKLRFWEKETAKLSDEQIADRLEPLADAVERLRLTQLSVERAGGDAMRFSVRDTGPGIPGEVKRRLFQPFRRVRGRRGYTFSGAGLGLAASRKLVEAMGGSLDVESRDGWGTRFRFTVSLPTASAARDRTAKAAGM